MKRLLLSVAVLAMVVAVTNWASAGDFATKSVWELGGDISYSGTSFSGTGAPTGTTGIFSIAPYAGYFIMDQFELGLRPVVAITTPPVGDSYTSLVIFAAPAWNFKLTSPSVTPFVEALVGFNSISSGGNSISGLAYGGRGGIKVLVGESGLLNVGVEYFSLDITPSGSPETYRSNTFSVGAGFTVFVH